MLKLSDFIKQQECIPVGCVPSAAVAAAGRGVSAWGVCPGRSAWGYLPRGCLPRGCLPQCMLGYTHPRVWPGRGCVYLSKHVLRQTPPPLVDRIRDTRL